MNKAIIDRRETSATSERSLSKNVFAVAPGVYRMKDLFVNVFMIQNKDASSWVLVDAGLKSSASKIQKMITEVGGTESKPSAIIMTHGHFDHRGALKELADAWDVPVYCHTMEVPYLSGKASYPPPDPFVGGGMMSYSSFLYPTSPINVEDHLEELPADGSVPGLGDWQWIHTPGHTPGHISLFREKDGVLIAGDAVVTTKQESVYAVAMQEEIVSGPPKYFTPDWGTAALSVKALAALEPNVIATGHGHSLYGDDARKALHKLARNFWQIGMPASGRYVKERALFDEEGPTYIPPAHNTGLYIKLGVALGLIAIGIVLYSKKNKKSFKEKVSDALDKKFLKGLKG